MDKGKVKEALEHTKDYGSTGVAAFLAYTAASSVLGDIPFEAVQKAVDWYMHADADQLIRVGALVLAVFICWAYKNKRFSKQGGGNGHATEN